MEFPRWLYSQDGKDRYFASEDEFLEAQKTGAWFASRLEAKQYADGALPPKPAAETAKLEAEALSALINEKAPLKVNPPVEHKRATLTPKRK